MDCINTFVPAATFANRPRLGSGESTTYSAWTVHSRLNLIRHLLVASGGGRVAGLENLMARLSKQRTGAAANNAQATRKRYCGKPQASALETYDGEVGHVCSKEKNIWSKPIIANHTYTVNWLAR